MNSTTASGTCACMYMSVVSLFIAIDIYINIFRKMKRRMASDKINLVNTCGICEEIVEESSILTHKCLEGFEQFIIDKNRYFYPACDNGAIIRRSAMDNNIEDIVLDESPNNFEKDTNVEHVALNESYISPLSETNSNISSNCSHDLIEIEELLIEEVSKREVLYNYNLPLTQRNRTITNEAWKAVSEALQGRLNPKEAAKRWKILRDSYYRKLSEEKLPSGSVRPSIRRKWKYFDQMDFLRDISLKKKQFQIFLMMRKIQKIVNQLQKKSIFKLAIRWHRLTCCNQQNCRCNYCNEQCS